MSSNSNPSASSTTSLPGTGIIQLTLAIDSLPYRWHPKFQGSDSTDITFKSSDGIYFALHRRNIETHAEAFPGPDIRVEEQEVINLTESGDILAIFFDFMYPRMQADIEKMEFGIVSQVAEAVEKYQVFSAMKVCEMRLKQLIPTHAAEILAHGIKHDYPSLVNAALPFLARRPLLQVLEKLPTQYYFAFCRYHEDWNKIFRDTIKSTCSTCDTDHLSDVIKQILAWEAMNNLTELQTALEKAAALPRCAYCHRNNRLPEYLQRAAKLCLEKIQTMESFSAL